MEKYWKEISVALVVIVLLTITTCSHNSQMKDEGEKIQLKKELKETKAKITEAEKATKALMDSLSLEDAKKDKRIVELNISNSRLLDSQKLREKELRKEKEKIAKYSYTQVEDFLSQRYETIDVKATESSVNLYKETPKLVVAELVEKDYMALDLQDKSKVIVNKDEQIKLEQEKTLNANLKVASVQAEKVLLKDGLQTAEEINKKSEKQIKSLKTKNFINKILVPISLGVGVFTGILITK